MKVLRKAATEQAVDVKEQTAGFDILCKKCQNVKTMCVVAVKCRHRPDRRFLTMSMLLDLDPKPVNVCLQCVPLAKISAKKRDPYIPFFKALLWPPVRCTLPA